MMPQRKGGTMSRTATTWYVGFDKFPEEASIRYHEDHFGYTWIKLLVGEEDMTILCNRRGMQILHQLVESGKREIARICGGDK
jgi:hypothetical protein